MSENSPRWPGANGSPGLDFSPWRRTNTDEQAADGGSDAPASPGSAADTASNLEDTAVSAPVATSAASPSRAAEPQPEPKVDESMYRDGAGATRLTPTASERVASTAKEWSAQPIPGIAPVKPVAPPVPVPAVTPTGRDEVDGSADEKVAATAVKKEPWRKPARAGRRTRKARLRLARIDPWSVMKTTFLFSIAFGIMIVVATFVVWSVLAGSGAIESVNTFLNTALGDQNTQFDIGGILSLQRVLGFAAIIAAIDVVIITALATLAAFLYNLAATAMGGLEVTLAED